MSTPDSPLETLRRLHELFRAWQHLQQTYANPSLDRAARQAAAIQALDLNAESLALLNECRKDHSWFKDVGDIFEDIEEWATLNPCDKGSRWDELALGMERPDARPGDPWDRHSWGQQLDFWIVKCAQVQPHATRTEADKPAAGAPPKAITSALGHHGTGNAAALRNVARALRAWGEFKGSDSPAAREAARTALDLATRHFNIIMEASNRWGCHGGASCALDMLRDITAERGRTDFGKYSGRWQHFTGPYLRLDVGLPDELERWANEFEKAEAVPAPGREGADVPERGGKAAEPSPLTPDAAASRASGGQGTSGRDTPDDGEPFYKPKYFQQWDIDDELLRRNAITGKQYTEGKVRRIKKKPASGKGKRAVYWYSEPDARRRWPDLFKIAEDDRTRTASKPPAA